MWRPTELIRRIYKTTCSAPLEPSMGWLSLGCYQLRILSEPVTSNQRGEEIK